LVHGRLLMRRASRRRMGDLKDHNRPLMSLRRHDPDQVQRVRLLAVSAPFGTPLEQAGIWASSRPVSTAENRWRLSAGAVPDYGAPAATPGGQARDRKGELRLN